jgi:alpha-glucosidase
MKKVRFICIVLPVFCVYASFAASSFMAGDGVAVFIPHGFDADGTLPSLILTRTLEKKGRVPFDWTVKPVFSKNGGKYVAKIRYKGDADLYGTGEVTGSLRRNKTKVTLWNTDNYCYQKDEGRRLYQSHPWVMGVRPDGSAFGIIADNTWKQDFKLSNPITITSEGPAFRVIIIEKENPVELQKALAEWTGNMALPPLWALGYQQSKYSYFPDSRVKEIADEFRNRKIPCDVIWMDIDYMDQFKVFTFDESRFPDPKELNDYLHGKDFKTVYMIDPGVKKEKGYGVYDQAIRDEHWVLTEDGKVFIGDVWPGACAFPDFTRPETRVWWAGLYKEFMALGIDGVWNDMNEPSVFNGPDGTMPEDALHRGGGGLPAGPHLRYHNVYGMLMVKASREGIMKANPDKRPFVLSRANFLGGQRYAATWTGDNQSTWDHLKLSIPMSLNLSLSGQPFNGPDIGGFEGDCSAELLGHWIALGAYYPFSRNHTSNNTIDQEPWAFGEEIEAVSRTAINRRYRLMPYLYTLFREASHSGTPVMRPVFFADFKDLDLRDEEETFLLGNDLLIVPRWASRPDMPSGDWDPVKLEKTDDGYQPMLMLRPGAIVPVGPVIQSTEEYTTEKITLLINPDSAGSASGILYDDAGDGFGYQSGDYAIHRFECSPDQDDRLKIEISRVEGDRKVDRSYRLGYVTDDDVIYLDWSTNLVQYVPLIAE